MYDRVDGHVCRNMRGDPDGNCPSLCVVGHSEVFPAAVGWLRLSDHPDVFHVAVAACLGTCDARRVQHDGGGKRSAAIVQQQPADVSGCSLCYGHLVLDPWLFVHRGGRALSTVADAAIAFGLHVADLVSDVSLLSLPASLAEGER